MVDHNAQIEFRQARRKAWVEQMSARLAGRDSQLLPFETIRMLLRQHNPLYQGIQEIPVQRIVGSVGRYREFNRSFLPLGDSLKSRWVNVRALANKQGWPPIEVYQVSGVYFVKDGNHRASVARSMGMPTIEAHVWTFPETLEIGPEDTLDDVLIRFGERNFLEETGLGKLRPDHAIRFTTPGRYGELQAQIEDMQATLSYIDRRELSFQEAVEAWYDLLYLPITEIIREAGLLSAFPDRSEADLFVWLSLHRAAIVKAYDLDPDSTLRELAQFLADRYREGGLDRLSRQVRRLLGREAPPPWRILDEADSTVTIEYETTDEAAPSDEVARLEEEEDSMLSKSYTKTGNFCRVTFKLAPEVETEAVHLVGDFNDWDTSSHPMKKLKDGGFSLTVSLPADKTYRFRYLLDGERWENDWAADAYVPNEYGSDDSLVKV